MTPADDMDNRLRRLFRGLPRAKAPGDFEAGVAARIAREGAPGRPWIPRLTPFAVPGLALLLVGALSYLAYLTQFRYEGGEPTRPAGEPSPATVPGSIREYPSPAAAPPAGGTEKPAAREAPLRGSGVRDRAPDRTDRNAVEKKLEPPAHSRPDRSASDPRGAKENVTTEPSLRGKNVPGRTLMTEPPLRDTAGITDSVAVSDTLNTDTPNGTTQGLRDTLRNPRPE